MCQIECLPSRSDVYSGRHTASAHPNVPLCQRHDCRQHRTLCSDQTRSRLPFRLGLCRCRALRSWHMRCCVPCAKVRNQRSVLIDAPSRCVHVCRGIRGQSTCRVLAHSKDARTSASRRMLQERRLSVRPKLRQRAVPEPMRRRFLRPWRLLQSDQPCGGLQVSTRLQRKPTSGMYTT